MRRREYRSRRRSFSNLILLMLACALSLILFSRYIALQSTYLPGPASYEPGEPFSTIAAQDGTSLSIFEAIDDPSAWTILYFHGNGEDLGDIFFILSNFRLRGFNIASYDYRGYGLTPGEPSEQNTYDDAEALYDHVLQQGVPESRIILLGRSLGSGIATELAVRRQPAGLILESALLSIYKLYLPIDLVPGDMYKNASKAPKVECPALVIHGARDQIVPIAHGRRLAERLPQADTFWIEEAGHNDLVGVAGKAYWERIREFARNLEN